MIERSPSLPPRTSHLSTQATERRLSPLQITTYCIPFKTQGSQSERRLIHYYFKHAASDISGYLPSDFWDRMVLQHCHHDPTVRQAVIALSAIHLDYATSEPSNVLDGLQQVPPETQRLYIKAVTKLRKYIATEPCPSRTVALICCLMFTCFEQLRGDHAAALAHISGGLSVYNAQHANTYGQIECSHDDEGMQVLEDVMMRIDLQATAFYDGRPPGLLCVSSERPGSPCINTDCFNSLVEARRSSSKLMTSAISFLTSNYQFKFLPLGKVPSQVSCQKRQLEEDFERWSAAFSAFAARSMERRDTPKAEQQAELKDIERAAALTNLYHHAIMMLVSGSLKTEPPTVSGFDADAGILLEYARVLIENDKITDANASNTMYRKFSFDFGIVAPLFLLAMKTSIPSVRDDAMALIAQSGRHEGFFNPFMTSAIIANLKRRKGTPRVDGVPEIVSADTELPLEWAAEEILQAEYEPGGRAMAKLAFVCDNESAQNELLGIYEVPEDAHAVPASTGFEDSVG